jgi:hypothetical protein
MLLELAKSTCSPSNLSRLPPFPARAKADPAIFGRGTSIFTSIFSGDWFLACSEVPEVGIAASWRNQAALPQDFASGKAKPYEDEISGTPAVAPSLSPSSARSGTSSCFHHYPAATKHD